MRETVSEKYLMVKHSEINRRARLFRKSGGLLKTRHPLLLIRGSKLGDWNALFIEEKLKPTREGMISSWLKEKWI
jgi:hypothetical protein